MEAINVSHKPGLTEIDFIIPSVHMWRTHDLKGSEGTDKTAGRKERAYSGEAGCYLPAHNKAGLENYHRSTQCNM